MLRRNRGGRHAHAPLPGLPTSPYASPRMPGSANGFPGSVVAVVSLVLLVLASNHAERESIKRNQCNQTIEINEHVTSPEVTSENRGLPMHCVYRFRINPDLHDWIITIRFNKFKVGRLINATTCLGGYVQIKDGREARGSPRAPPGYFCGEVDRPQDYISETSYVSLIFHVTNFSEGTYIAFDSRAEQQFELFARYGPNPQLYSDRRGRLISGTFCDRVFHDCRMGACLIQSPGYPGIYPRNLRCKYHVPTATGYVKLFIENEEINVDGQRCEDVILCPNRPVMTHCPYDYVSVYDGRTEESPLIGTFCGRGKLPYAITGSGRNLLLVFVSSPAGPFLNTGFNFNVGSLKNWVGVGATKVNGSCDGVFHRDPEIPPDKRRFYSLATWYHPQTSCSFTIWGWETEIIRLEFKSFRIHRPDSAILDDRGCVETLTVYDAPYADEARIIAMFCDSWSPVIPPNQDFVSTGNAMFVRFHSEVGSYAGSSLKYMAQFDYFNAYTYGIPVKNTACDERFPSSKLSRGVFSSPLNRLLFTRQPKLKCTYSFLGTTFERIILTLSSVNFTVTSSQKQCIDCIDDPVDKIIIEDLSPVGMQRIRCICGIRGRLPRTPNPIRILSSGSMLDVKLLIEHDDHMPRKQNSVNSLFFQGTYEFLHGPKCGNPLLKARSQGELVYPSEELNLDDDVFSENNDMNYVDLELISVRCVWTLLVNPKKSLFLRFESYHFPGDCGVDRIEIKLPLETNEYADNNFVAFCEEKSALGDLPIITSRMLHAGRILVEFHSSTSAEANFRLVWTELVEMEQEYVAQARHSMQDGCSFVCGGSNVCIPHELVCNGVRNCPHTENSESSSDEDFHLCRSDVDSINWLAIGLGAAGGGVLATCFILIVHRCCRKDQDTDPG